MKEKIVFAVKSAVWLIGFAVIFLSAANLLKPKYLYTSEYYSPETEIWESFYAMPKNSVDILFMGSSHMYNTVNPAVFFEKTGLTGQNLSSSNQDIPTLYFYLKEALRFQSPEYVVIEGYGFKFHGLAMEECYKRSLDDMKFSKIKAEAVRCWAENLPDEKPLARFFTISDYHSRWDELDHYDFNYKKYKTEIFGYIPVYYSSKDVVHDFYRIPAEPFEIESTTAQYFEKIVILCEDNGIKLAVMIAPDASWNVQYSIPIEKLCKEYKVPFYDYNSEEKYESLGIENSKDWANAGHLNIYGAEKTTERLAFDLAESGFINADYTNELDKYRKKLLDKWKVKNSNMIVRSGRNIGEYIQYITDEDYIVCIQAENAAYLNEEQIKALNKLGCESSFKEGENRIYTAVVHRGKTVLENMGNEFSESEVKTDVMGVKIEIFTPYEDEKPVSMTVNNRRYEMNDGKMYIAVYSLKQNKLIDYAAVNDENVITARYPWQYLE